MEEIVIKLEFPKGIENKIKAAIERALKEFLGEIEFSLAKEIVKESELTEEQAKELGREVKAAVARKHA